MFHPEQKMIKWADCIWKIDAAQKRKSSKAFTNIKIY